MAVTRIGSSPITRSGDEVKPVEARKVGVGVVGLGFMGRTHVEAFSQVSKCRLVAVADQEQARCRGVVEGGGNLGNEPTGRIFDPESTCVFQNHEELLECEGIDLVSITTPTPTHVGIAIAAIESGRHVLVEKPVDLTVAGIERIADAAHANGVLAMPAHCMRSWPAWSWMRDQVKCQTYGELKSARFIRAGATPDWNRTFYLDEAKSGGAAVDLHIHDADYIVHCLGLPSAVISTGTRKYVRTRYLFDGEIRVEAEGGWRDDPNAPFTMRAELECSEGTMYFDFGREPEVVVVHENGTTAPHPEASIGGTGYEVQARRLVDAILAGASESPVTMRDAMSTARLIGCEIASLDLGGKTIQLHGS